ncbi:MAG: hypothetical protein R3C45_09645 [Phycisphaerales bacterium]
MRSIAPVWGLCFVLCQAWPAQAALFSESFNTDVSSGWTINPAGGTDYAVNFSFDYSTIGVPEAPNTGSGDQPTRGMQFRVNETSNIFGGVTASPTGLDLGGGDFTLTFDWWENVVGPLPNGGFGLTQLGLAGVLTSGTAVNGLNQPTTDAVYFAATGDGGSASDWRVYSPTPSPPTRRRPDQRRRCLRGPERINAAGQQPAATAATAITTSSATSRRPRCSRRSTPGRRPACCGPARRGTPGTRW